MTAQIISVAYVLASTEDQARKLAALVVAGTIPPMARSREELVALRFAHPLPMIGQLLPFAVYTGLRSHASKLSAGTWGDDVQAWFDVQRREGKS